MLVLRDALRVPGLLSLARVPLGLAFPFVWSRPAAALTVIGAAAVTDVLDGFWARTFGQTTETGAALDPLVDKAFAALVLGTLVAAGALSPLEAVLLSTRELVELPLAVYVLARRVESPERANALGKLTTVLEFATIVLVLVGSSHAQLACRATALTGLLAGVLYWRRACARGRRETAGAGTALATEGPEEKRS